MKVTQVARLAMQRGRPSLPTLVRAVAQGTESARRLWPQLAPSGADGTAFYRTCQQTFKESRQLLSHIRRSAYAVLASSAVLAPIVIACISVTGRHVHSHNHLWWLAIALAGVSALGLIVATLSAVRCLGLSGLGTPLQSLVVSSQKLRRGADLTQQGGVLLERAEQNRQRAEQAMIPLVIGERALVAGIVLLVFAGAAVLVAEAF